jgi:hypothetical protein
MQASIGPDWVAAALTLTSTAVALIWPNAGVMLMAAGALVLLAGIRVDGWKVSTHRVDRKRLWQVIVGISIMVIILSVATWYRWYQLLPYEEFVFINDSYPSVGNPTKQAALSSKVDHYWYDNGIVIYISESQMFYVIPYDDDKKIIAQQDKSWGLEKSDYDESTIRREWKYSPPIPANRKPPIYGVKRYWDKWPWLGWRVSQCSYPMLVHSQRFEHGIVVGPILLSPKAADTENIAIFDDGSVKTRRASERLESRECI